MLEFHFNIVFNTDCSALHALKIIIHMKILRIILYVILMITAVFCAILLFCVANPDAGKELSDRFNGIISGSSGTASGLSGNSSSLSEDTPADETGSICLPDISGVLPGLSSGYEYTEEDPKDVPSSYSSRTGFEEISANEIPVTDQEASGLLKTLSPGNTGDDLTFDPLYYPYYEMLDDNNKALYRQIYANATDLNNSFSPVHNPKVKNLRTAFQAVVNDHPELFWLNTSFQSLSAPSGACVEMDLSFNAAANDLDTSKDKFNESVSQILTGARNLSDAPSKEEYVHQVLIDSVSYDLNANMNQSAYSALVFGKTVCAGYSRAFQYLMQQLGVPAYYCAGNAGEPHAWNIIKLDDGFYNVDTTWDDTPGHEYDYYNMDDDYFNGTHRRRELSVYLPPCNGTEFAGPGPAEEEVPEETASDTENTEEEEGDHLIQSAYENSLKSLEDYSLSESDLLYDMDSYYKKAEKEIKDHGLDSYEFLTAVHGKDLMEEIRKSNRTGGYKEAYMEKALKEIGAKSCFVKMRIEELQGENYLIKHIVEVN